MHAYLAKLDGAVGEFKAEQESAEMALKGAFFEFTGLPNPTAASTRANLASTVGLVVETYKRRALAVLADRMLGAAHTGVVDASLQLGDAWGADKLESAAASAREAVRAGQLPAVTATVTAALDRAGQETLNAGKRFAIEVQRRKDMGRQERSAAIEVSEKLKIVPTFSFVDARGARWAAARHLAVSVRGALLTARNEAFLDVMAGAGAKIFMVDHADAKEGVHNMPFTLVAGVIPGMPTYAEIRGKVFHPNARSIASIP